MLKFAQYIHKSSSFYKRWCHIISRFVSFSGKNNCFTVMALIWHYQRFKRRFKMSVLKFRFAKRKRFQFTRIVEDLSGLYSSWSRLWNETAVLQLYAPRDADQVRTLDFRKIARDIRNNNKKRERAGLFSAANLRVDNLSPLHHGVNWNMIIPFKLQISQNISETFMTYDFTGKLRLTVFVVHTAIS